MNVSIAKRNIPKDIKSLKSKVFFISITSIPCRIEVNHPVTRLPVALLLLNILYHITIQNTSSIQGFGGIFIQNQKDFFSRKSYEI